MKTSQGRVFTDDGEFYDGLPVIETSIHQCIVRRPDGSFLRHYEGQGDEIFTSLDRALVDCGVMPDDHAKEYDVDLPDDFQDRERMFF